MYSFIKRFPVDRLRLAVELVAWLKCVCKERVLRNVAAISVAKMYSTAGAVVRPPLLLRGHLLKHKILKHLSYNEINQNSLIR